MNQITDILKRKRGNRKQEEIAVLTGLSQKTYSNYETGRRKPEFETIVHLSKVLDFQEELVSIILEQNVPRGTSSSTIQVPGQDAGLIQLVSAQRELQIAADKIQQRIDELLFSESSNSDSETALNRKHKDTLPKEGKSDKAQ